MVRELKESVQLACPDDDLDDDNDDDFWTCDIFLFSPFQLSLTIYFSFYDSNSLIFTLKFKIQ